MDIHMIKVDILPHRDTPLLLLVEHFLLRLAELLDQADHPVVLPDKVLFSIAFSFQSWIDYIR